jgi:hypothetical protein
MLIDPLSKFPMLPMSRLSVAYEVGMDYALVSVPVEDVIHKRPHQRENCPVENCTGECDYLVLLLSARGYRWRPDHQLPQGSEAVDRFEQGLKSQDAALEQVRRFLLDHQDAQLYEANHCCDPFVEECGKFKNIICKELCDFYLQSGNGAYELMFPASQLQNLHLVDGMEEIYNRRVVLGSPIFKAIRLSKRGISIPPRGRIARPIVQSDTLEIGYYFVRYKNDDRAHESRYRPPLRR